MTKAKYAKLYKEIQIALVDMKKANTLTLYKYMRMKNTTQHKRIFYWTSQPEIKIAVRSMVESGLLEKEYDSKHRVWVYSLKGV